MANEHDDNETFWQQLEKVKRDGGNGEVPPSPPSSKTPWWKLGQRFIVALFASAILIHSGMNVKFSHSQDAEIQLTVETRDPNTFEMAIAIYLLGVATEFNPEMLLRILLNRGEEK